MPYSIDENNNDTYPLIQPWENYMPVTFITSLPIGWSLFAIPFNATISLQDIIVSFNNTNYTWQEAINKSLIMPWIYTVNRSNGMLKR